MARTQRRSMRCSCRAALVPLELPTCLGFSTNADTAKKGSLVSSSLLGVGLTIATRRPLARISLAYTWPSIKSWKSGIRSYTAICDAAQGTHALIGHKGLVHISDWYRSPDSMRSMLAFVPSLHRITNEHTHHD